MNYVINYYMSAFQNFGISIHISSHTRYLSKAEQQRLFLLFLRCKRRSCEAETVSREPQMQSEQSPVLFYWNQIPL